MFTKNNPHNSIMPSNSAGLTKENMMTTFDKNVEAFKKVAVIMAALNELSDSVSEHSMDTYVALIMSHGLNKHDADGLFQFWADHSTAFVV